MTTYDEAKLILSGKTMMQATNAHLQALNDHYMEEIVLLCHEINSLTTLAMERR